MHIQSTRTITAIVGLVFYAVAGRETVYAEVEPDTAFHVACTGNDTNAGNKNSPFATIERAKQAVREQITAGLNGNVRVIIHAGTYELSQPLTFDPHDSGTTQHSITYAAVSNETVIISGGRRITDWTRGDGNVWTAEIPEVKTNNWYFRNLYVSDHRATRARNPNANEKMPYFRLTGVSLSPDQKSLAVTLSPGQVVNWKNLSDVELVILRNWEHTRQQIQTANPLSGILILKPPHISTDPRTDPHIGSLCFLENARAFLDQPGEWYLDRTNGRLHYWPQPNETLTTANIVAPVLTGLVEIRGNSEHPVQNLHFVGIKFAHTDSQLPSFGYIGRGCGYGIAHTEGVQNSFRLEDVPPRYEVESAIKWSFAKFCSLENCVVTHVGGNGLRIGIGCKQTMILGNEISDIGNNGLILGFIALPTRPFPTLTEQPSNNSVVNNVISGCGKAYLAGSGIFIRNASESKIDHNLVQDTAMHGIILSGEFHQPPPGISENNYVTHNHIRNTATTMQDSGGIYLWGITKKGVIQGNVVNDVARSLDSYACHGIYFDDNTTGYTVESNVVYNIPGKILEFVNSKPESHLIRDNFWYNPNRFVPSQRGYAMSFAGDAFLDFPHQATLESPQMTVEAWAYLVAPPTAGRDPSAWIVSKNSDELTDGNYALLVSHQNIGAYLNIGGGRDNCYAAWSSTGPLSSNIWHHVALTYDAKDLRLYCDGQPVATTPINRPRTSSSGFLRIGKRVDGATPSFPGLIDDVRIYNRAIPSETMAAHFAGTEAQASAAETGLVFSWNGADLYNKFAPIIAAAGPEEPYRTRFQNKKMAEELAPSVSK